MRNSAVRRLALRPGLNVMDLSAYTTELQSLVIRSVIEWVYDHANDTLVDHPRSVGVHPASARIAGLAGVRTIDSQRRRGRQLRLAGFARHRGRSQERPSVGRRVASWRPTRSERSETRACAHPRQEADRRRRHAIAARAILRVLRPHRREDLRATAMDVEIDGAACRAWQDAAAVTAGIGRTPP